jgi:hypothetical protein
MRILVVVFTTALVLSAGIEVQAGEPSARKLVARLTDGNEYRVANNKIVDQLVAKGEKSLAPLRQALLDEEFEGRGYAAWAIGKVLKATGRRPLEMTAALHAAAGSGNDYIRTLAGSALSILTEKTVTRSREKGWKPNPYTVAALRDTPKPGATPDEMIAALPERQGFWRDIILDRMIMAGEKSLPALQRASGDEAFGARKEAEWGLRRLSAAVSAKQATPEELIAGFASGGNETVPANNALVDRLLLHGMAAVPALVAELKDPARVRKSYAYWALAVLLRATGERPEEATKILTDRFQQGTSPISILGM